MNIFVNWRLYVHFISKFNSKCNLFFNILCIRVIPRIRQSINKSSVILLTEICSLISSCFVQKKSIVENIAREFQAVQALISFLNVDLMGKFGAETLN